MLKVGEPAPAFDMKDEHGATVRLADFRGKSAVVLMFYPGDSTPGCTKQLCTARDDADKYAQAGIAVFGVNNGGAESHEKFSSKYNMRTPLLVDENAAIAKAYDALMPIPLLKIINRTVVGIDKDGTIRYYKRGMPPTSEIISAMTNAGAGAPA